MDTVIDLKDLTTDELHTIHRNALRLKGADGAISIAQELYRRGKLRRSQKNALHWSEARLELALEPFVEVAKSVLANRRTTYTNGGGLRRRRKSDPDRMMVD